MRARLDEAETRSAAGARAGARPRSSARDAARDALGRASSCDSAEAARGNGGGSARRRAHGAPNSQSGPRSQRRVARTRAEAARTPSASFERVEPGRRTQRRRTHRARSTSWRWRARRSRGPKTRRARANADGPTCANALAALTAERDAAAARLGMLDQDSERARTAREEMLAEIATLAEQTRASHAHVEGLRARRRRDAGCATRRSAPRTRGACRRDRRSSSPTCAWPRTSEREAPAAANAIARGWPRSRPSSACWFRSLRRIRRPTTNAATSKRAIAGEPDAVVDELPRLREELGASAANVNLNAEAERDEVAERERFCARSWTI